MSRAPWGIRCLLATPVVIFGIRLPPTWDPASPVDWMMLLIGLEMIVLGVFYAFNWPPVRQAMAAYARIRGFDQ